MTDSRVLTDCTPGPCLECAAPCNEDNASPVFDADDHLAPQMGWYCDDCLGIAAAAEAKRGRQSGAGGAAQAKRRRPTAYHRPPLRPRTEDATPPAHLSPEDLQALQIVRSAALVALTSGAIAAQFRERVQAAAERVTEIVQQQAEALQFGKETCP